MVRGTGDYDAVVVGSGPNGLVAALTLAKAGHSVQVIERQASPGGGCRSAEVTLPGFIHDICSAIHPTAVVSPAFRALAIESLGVQLAYPEIPIAHPLPNGQAAVLRESLFDTAVSLGPDGKQWRLLMEPFLRKDFIEGILKPMWWPPWKIELIRFGLLGLLPCSRLVKRFKASPARALFAGCAAHSVVPLQQAGTASFGLVLALAGHAVNWPCIKGGSQQLVAALVEAIKAHGGEIRTGHPITSFSQLPPAKRILFDINPRQIAAICGPNLPEPYSNRLRRFKHGPGVFKIDWALNGPIPWRNQLCGRAGTVHVGGTFEEIALAESQAASGVVPEKPFVLVAQQSLFDSSRAPAGKHTGWAYCHVPNNCAVDMTSRIEAQIERFAPGFQDLILARHTISASQYESHNAAMPGGDIGGGANDLVAFLFRPMLRWNPYSTPNPKIFICSSSTPPGGGVHGMCGYLAAQSVLRGIHSK